jgi:hypothetical protein
LVSIALPVAVLGYRQGSYGELQQAEAAAIACVFVCALLLTGERFWRSPAFAAVGGCLALLTVWTALSLLWAPSADDVVPDIVLMSLYLTVFTLVGLVARRNTLATWCDGLAAGVAVIVFLSLTSRFFPHLFRAARDEVTVLPGSASRLAFPVGYWNGLAILVACSLPLFLRSALSDRGGSARKVVSVGFVSAIGTIVYLASSRGGAITAVAAAGLYVLLSGRRWPSAAGAVLLGAVGAAIAIGLVARNHDLVDRPFSKGAVDAGPRMFAVVLVVYAVAGGAYALADRFALAAWRPSRRLTTGLAAVAAICLVAVLAAADLPARFEAFKARPTFAASANSSIESHFLSGGSNGRWQLWGSAIREFRSAPLQGGGAGSFQGWWAQHGTLAVYVRDTHSLYLQTLGELGMVGFLLIVGFVGSGLWFGLRLVLGTNAAYRFQPAAPLATFAAFGLAASIDWIWQLPVIGVVAIMSVAMLTTAAPERAPAAASRQVTVGSRAVPLATALVAASLFVFAALDVAAQLRLNRSQQASGRSDGATALAEAQAARALEPWSARPLLQIALAEEAFGSLPVSRLAIEDAVRKDASNWRLRLVAARLEAKTGHIGAATRELAAARALNPRSPLFAPGG